MNIDPGLFVSVGVAAVVLLAQRRLTSVLATTSLWAGLLLVGRVWLDGYSAALMHTLALSAPLVLLAMWGLSRLRVNNWYWVVMPFVATVLVFLGLMTITLDLSFD